MMPVFSRTHTWRHAPFLAFPHVWVHVGGYARRAGCTPAQHPVRRQAAREGGAVCESSGGIQRRRGALPKPLAHAHVSRGIRPELRGRPGRMPTMSAVRGTRHARPYGGRRSAVRLVAQFLLTPLVLVRTQAGARVLGRDAAWWKRNLNLFAGSVFMSTVRPAAQFCCVRVCDRACGSRKEKE